MENRSYFTRLLVVFLSLFFGVAVFIFYQTSYTAGSELLKEFKAREANTLDVVAWLVEGKAPYADAAALRADVAELGKRFGVRVTYVSGGTVLADSEVPDGDLAKLDDHSTRPEILDAVATGTGQATRYSSTLQTEMLYVAKRMAPRQGLPEGVLRIAVPYSTVQQLLGESRSHFLAVVAAMTVCAALLVFFIVRRTQGMLRGFSQAVDDLGRGESPDKLRVCPGSEFKPLMDSINTLAKRTRKHARHLHETRSQFEAVLARMSDAVAVLDEAGVIIAHNPALTTMVKTRSTDSTGRHVLEAGLGLDVHEAVGRCLAGGATTPERFLARLADGLDVDVDLAPYVTAKGKRRLILVLHDVSALKNTERLLRDFVINASHQLRTPLTSIQGFAATLLDTPPEEPEQARGMLSTILKRSQEMSGVVTSLLHTASPQAGKTNPDATTR